MKRRKFIALLGGAAAAWPVVARAQTGKVYRVAFLVAPSFASGSAAAGLADGIIRRLGQSSLASGANLEFVRRAAEGHLERLPALVSELLAMKVDVIVTGGYPAAAAAKAGTSTVPIVINNAGD